MLFCPVLTKIQSARTTRLSPRSAALFASFASSKSFPLTLFADPHPLTLVASIFYKNTGGGAQFSRGARRGELSPRAATSAPPLPAIPPPLWGFLASLQ